MSTNNILAYGILLCVLITSCDSNMVYDQYKSYPTTWHKDSLAIFKITPPDSINDYDLFVNIRNNNDYKYSNLQLIVALEYPNGKTIKDTLEYLMAKPNGEFLGSGFTDVKENKLWYKGNESKFVFDEQGEYTVSIQQAMRENGKVNGVEELEGILAVGFRVEPSN